MKRVGIYAGTFDPIHEGHLAFAREAMGTCNLDKVFFLVEPRPRRKQGVRALEHRVHMTQLAIKNERNFGSIVLDQAQFSVVETLPVLQARFMSEELFLLMGEDVVAHLAQWPHINRLLKSVTFIVGIRKGKRKDIEDKLESLQKARGITFKYHTFVPTHYDIASSKIRLALKRGVEPKGLPRELHHYIEQEGLYSSSSSE